METTNLGYAVKVESQYMALREEYPDFEDFLADGITDLMGFNCTDIQRDIGAFMALPHRLKMVQAQRGQAKTTIAAFYAVWNFLHDPTYRVLIFSAGSGMAGEISTWITQIIMNWDILWCLRPRGRDRSGVESFDINGLLKGPNKSPSVTCLGIESNMQGKRADLLLADDIESSKNSRTMANREKLIAYTRDFTSICADGEILYLGTPQSSDSIYNTLPSRGYLIRIWPGRYPTVEEEEGYGGNLAPLIVERMEADPSLRTGYGFTGKRGAPVDPVLKSEESLVATEIDQGPSYFQLQHMLSTALSDLERYPLKPRDLMFAPLDGGEVPGKWQWSPTPENELDPVPGSSWNSKLYRGVPQTKETFHFTHIVMYVDPAGGGANGDETGYAVVAALLGYIFVLDWGGVPGGHGDESYDALTRISERWGAGLHVVEENFGKGTWSTLWKQHSPHLLIEDLYEHGQKELRIIDRLEPIVARHRLIVNDSIPTQDVHTVQGYSVNKRAEYQGLFQFEKITRERGALIHDDRLDALAGAVKSITDLLAVDEEKALSERKAEEYQKWIRDPFGNGHDPFENSIERPGKSALRSRRR